MRTSGGSKLRTMQTSAPLLMPQWTQRRSVENLQRQNMFQLSRFRITRVGGEGRPQVQLQGPGMCTLGAFTLLHNIAQVLTLSLSSCAETQFSCKNGICIDLLYRCPPITPMTQHPWPLRPPRPHWQTKPPRPIDLPDQEELNLGNLILKLKFFSGATTRMIVLTSQMRAIAKWWQTIFRKNHTSFVSGCMNRNKKVMVPACANRKKK